MNNRIDEIESSVVEKTNKQIQKVTENFDRKIDESNVSNEYKLNCVPVSYTHLDVYKRQVRTLSSRFDPAILLCIYY